MHTHQVFDSHTSDMAAFPRDRSFVQAVLDAANRAGMVSVDMRYFAATESAPADYCQKRVRDCDIYVAVIGFRYGSIVPGKAISYTELEFEAATAAGLPRLVFLLREKVEPPPGMVDSDRSAVEGFRQRLWGAGVVVREFSSDTGLELEVFHALREVVGNGRSSTPRQLPAVPPNFVGRKAELGMLTSLLQNDITAHGTVLITAIGGTAGVGKTALAVYWARHVADLFPDGQLYVNLQGFDPGGLVVDPVDAIREFLDALGVAPQEVPVGLNAQAALYRSLLIGRRMLIVLDNARDSAQVRPLLPSTPNCLVLVTSRNQLSGLVVHEGARTIELDVLAPGESRELLERRLGAGRVADEPAAAEKIMIRCAGLPLALAIVAARASTNPRLPLRTLAAELSDIHDELDALTGEDAVTDMRAVFSWSYRTLTPEAARLFRLLGLHPGPDISAHAAASLVGLATQRIRPVLNELVRAHLITERIPHRYSFHDLLRVYAAEQARASEPSHERRAAIHRVLDHYLHTAHTADRLLDPAREPVSLAPPRPGTTPETPADRRQAIEWFTTEYAVLLAAVDAAAEAGLDTCTWQLALAFATFLHWRGHWREWAAVESAALESGRRLSDPQVQERAHRGLADACTRLGRFDEARSHLKQAIDLATQANDLNGLAHAHHSVAIVCERQGYHAEALAHAEQALEIYVAANNRGGQARLLNAVGWCHAMLGDYQQAVTYCQQSLVLVQELGDRRGQADTWDSLGYAYHHLHQYAQATTSYQRGLQLYRELSARYDEAATLIRLGDSYRAADDLAGARNSWQHALAILDDLRHPDADKVRTKVADLQA